ncbi:MAG: glycosyltransferase family 2 protein [Segatella copri]
MTRISIIILVYNVEQYIEECLMSVTNQSITEGIECILVDDCGQDNSAAIAKRFVDSYQGDIRFTFIQREKNGGLSAARNTGIKAATGKYVYFLDSDDCLVPSAIETLISIGDKNGALGASEWLFRL